MSLILQNNVSITKCACLALCVGLGLSFGAVAAGRITNKVIATGEYKRVADNERVDEEDAKIEGLQQTLNLNFSPEYRERLRKALDDFARSMDPSHDRIEERRRAMQDNIEARFFEADTDGNGTLDRQEATERLPQVARHFNKVDANQDGVISLGELVDAQARILGSRRAAEATLELEKQQKQQRQEETLEISKTKPKQAVEGLKRKTM